MKRVLLATIFVIVVGGASIALAQDGTGILDLLGLDLAMLAASALLFGRTIEFII
jgi:hypothetical protein